MKKQLYDRRLVPYDDKDRKLDLSRMNLVPPAVGICDEPLRLYPLNNEWAKIVIGFVSWLATIAPWRDADDESYSAIQEIETFMIGCDPISALVLYFQLIVNTDYNDLSDELKELWEAIQKLQQREGIPDAPIVYLADPVLLDLGGGCDYDNLYAAIVQFIDYAHMQNLRVIRSFEAATSNLETVAEIISAIPIIGWLPFDEALELADTFLENMGDNYLGNYTQLLRDEYACDLFCLFKDDCQVDFFRTAAYFTTRAAIDIANLDFQDSMELLTQGIFSGEELVDAVFAFFFIILAFGGSYAGETPEHLALVFEAFSNDSNPDWAILCACANDYDITYGFTYNDAAGWTVVFGDWIDPGNSNIYNEHLPGVHESLKVERTFSPVFDGLDQVNTRNPAISYSNTHVGAGTYLSITHDSGIYTATWFGQPPIPTEFVLPVTLNGVSYISIEVREDLVGDGGATRLGGVQLIGSAVNKPPDPPV